MSEPEKSLQEFLQRWSRRKLDVTQRETKPTNTQTPEGDKAEIAPAAGASPPDGATNTLDAATSAFDPASLPPIESINAASDLRAFLAPGVPLELTRAALRRAWVTDPSIRDFIGIAENQWDFTKPDSVPGFGSLEPTAELHRMVAELHSAISSSDPVERSGALGKTAMPDPPATSLPDQAVASPITAERIAVSQLAEKNAATQNDLAGEEETQPAAIRKHGGALPK
jgi:hypothetical protein